jgi:hypothetical protein
MIWYCLTIQVEFFWKQNILFHVFGPHFSNNLGNLSQAFFQLSDNIVVSALPRQHEEVLIVVLQSFCTCEHLLGTDQKYAGS